MRKVALSLALMTACGPATRAVVAQGPPQGLTTTSEPAIVRLSSPDEQEAPVPPPSTEAPPTTQMAPSRPAQREVSSQVTPILDITPTPVLQTDLLACLKRYE